MKVEPVHREAEIALLPSDWEMEDISSIASIVGGGTPSTNIAEYWDGQIPWVSAGDVSQASGRHIHSTADQISQLGLESCSASIMPGGTTVIIARGATVGRMAQLGSGMAFNQTCYGLHPTGKVDQDYLYYAMLFSVDSIKALTYGTIFGTITTNSFRQWRIPLPPLPEQRAIAEALSDVDALIAALGRLIAKKCAIKQGTMQKLFTKKTRLPGFEEPWETVRFSDIADKTVRWSIVGGPFGSNLTTSDYVSDGVRIIQLQNIGEGRFHNDYAIYTSEEKASELLSNNIYPGEIILSKMGDPVARCCFVPDDDQRYLMASDGIRLVVDQRRFDKRFVHDYINSNYFREKAIEASTGTTRQRISLTDLKRLPFVAPPLPEQRAIATVLSDMDAEIAALEARRDKTRALKQGMMQELLTGKTRLV